ncbi:MAG: hypothetical protein CMF74_18145, partial [Maricaulis sp.]|nr:hypothetical protein [Maricaulis sp.]
MGEFKDGTLKSGGSGRKVTNPKQAMAIALSEANRMNQGGIVGLAQMQSPFANSIRPQFQDMGPRPLESIIGDQRIPPVASPMQRNFSQIQGQGQQPLDAYKGYLQSTYILPMQQNEVQKVNQFVDAVGQAERQFFGGQQGGKTFGGRLQPGMPGSGLVGQGQRQELFANRYQGPLPLSNLKPTPGGPLDTSPAGLQNEGGPQPSILQPTNQAPAVMPPMNMAPAVEFEPLRMNQGGMMYSDIMNRPMFQTPQQRQGMGIMAGVAPVRGYAEGDLVSDDFFSLEQTEEGSGMNLRDITDFFFDPSDPIDYATLGLIAFPPALIAARLAKMGVKGAKAAEQVQKVVKLQEAIPKKLGGGTSRAQSGLQVQMAGLPAALAEEDIAMADEMPQDMGGIAALAQQPEPQERRPVTRGERKMRKMREAEQMAMGGIASLPRYNRGEAVIKGATALFNRLFRKASKGEDVRKDALDAEQAGKLTPNQTDEILNQAESQMDLPGIPAATKKADDVIEGRQGNIITRNPGKTVTALGVGAPTAAIIGYGAFGPDAPTPPATPTISQDQQDLANANIALNAQQAAQQTPTQPVVEEEVETAEPATGITKFLLGTDAAFGGDEEGEKGAIDFLRGKPADFLQKTMNYLADPRTRYGLARAAESREGVVDRNFFTDFTLGQAEYDEAKAKRDYMESQARNLDRTDTE